MTAVLLAALALAAPIDGRVQERGSGDPIPGATVVLEADGAQIELATDETGRFASDVPHGTWTVRIEAPDHTSATLSVDVPTDTIRVFLDPRPPYLVVVEAFDQTPHPARHRIDAEMALETPGTHEDAVRLVQSLPGAAVQREYSPTAGNLVIRGSAPGDSRYYLDGVELPYLYHFNQYASVFPTSQLDALEMYSSTFGASFGDAVGAVIEAQSKADRPAVLHGSAGVSFVMAGADVRAPLPGGWWLSAAGRRSYQDLFGERTDQYTVWPVFHDFSLRAGRDGDGGDTQLFVWGAGDGYTRAAGELDVLDPVERSETPQLDYRRAFQVAGASHVYKHGRARIVGAVVHDVLRAELDGGGRETLRTVYLTSRWDDRWKLGSGLHLAGGYEVRAARTRLEVADAGRYGLLVAEEAPALAHGVEVDAVKLRARTAVYGQLQWSPGAVTVLPGVRIASDTRGEPVLAEPRLTVRWQAASQTALKAAIGLYHQAPETEHLVGDPDLPTTRAWQAAAGLEQTFADRLELGVDAWGKAMDDVLVYPVDGPAEVAGSGRAFGVEVLTRYRLKEYFFLRGWIGLMRSQVLRDGVWVPADGDQPLAAGVVASWDVAEHWNIAVRYRVGSGLPFTGVDGSLYDATLDQWVPLAGEHNAERMPLYQKLDLHAAHTWTFDRWSLVASGDLWFVPRSSAQLYPAYNYDFSERGWVIGPTLLPLLGLRAEF